MRMYCSPMLKRLELSAALTVIAVLLAGLLAKLSHVWWAVVITAGLCLAGEIIERLTMARRTQLPSTAS